ncbi:MAG TPA: hypothetical protein VGB46_04910 [Flavisolibacter sp.]|jgi:hypothetical protein
MKTTKQLALLSLLIFASLSYSSAQEGEKQATVKKPSPLRFLVGLAAEFGGDGIATIYFDDGSEQTMHAGQGVSVSFGGQLKFASLEQLLLRATAGFKYVTTKADNVHIRLTRIPLHLTASWMATKKLRFGAGLVTHRNISFNTGGLAGNYKLQPASGPIFEASYAGIGLSYTIMKYKDQVDNSYSANAIGITFSYVINSQ